MTVEKLKSSVTVGNLDWRAVLMRLFVTLVLLAAILKIGS